MGSHHGGRRGHGGHDDRWRREYDGDSDDRYRSNDDRTDGPWSPAIRDDGARRMRVPWAAIGAAFIVWTALAGVVFLVVDPVVTWIAANAGLLANTGTAAATAAGGEVAGAVLGQIDVSTFFGQAMALIAAIAKPLVVFVWLLGSAALLLAPAVLPRLSRRYLSRRH